MQKKIKTFTDACKALKLKATALPDVSMLPKIHQKSMIAHYKLIIIAEALNEGWKPNWNDGNETKYQPYFRVNASAKQPSGFGLSYGDYGTWCTLTRVGSRLCFKSRELAEYAGKQFEKLYVESYLIQQ